MKPQDAPLEDWPLRSSPAYRAAYPQARLLLGAVARVLAPRLRVRGSRHVPRRGPVILAPNHISDADPPFVLNGSPRPLWFMAKRELFDMRGLGPVIRFCQSFPVELGGADRAALRRTEALLGAGQAVVMFPEGRVSPQGETGEILPGVAMLALRARVPVVPVGLHGTQHVIPYGKLVPRPTLRPVRVHFGAPLRFDDLQSMPRRQARDAAAQRLEAALHQAVAAATKG